MGLLRVPGASYAPRGHAESDDESRARVGGAEGRDSLDIMLGVARSRKAAQLRKPRSWDFLIDSGKRSARFSLATRVRALTRRRFANMRDRSPQSYGSSARRGRARRRLLRR